MDLAFERHTQQGWTILSVAGELDLHTSPQLAEALATAMDAGTPLGGRGHAAGVVHGLQQPRGDRGVIGTSARARWRRGGGLSPTGPDEGDRAHGPGHGAHGRGARRGSPRPVNGPSPSSATLDLPSDPALHTMIRTFIGACGTAWAIDDERVEDSKLAVSELLAFADGPRIRVSLELDHAGSIRIRSLGVRAPEASEQDDLRLRLLGAIGSELRWDGDAVSMVLAGRTEGLNGSIGEHDPRTLIDAQQLQDPTHRARGSDQDQGARLDRIARPSAWLGSRCCRRNAAR